MEMLAEMEGSEETLRGLNNAEHKPEDSMQTDEWMYELKHRKSWVTGKYIPSGGAKEGEQDDGAELKLNQENLSDGGMVPPNWQEELADEQVALIRSSWNEVKDKEAFSMLLHESIQKNRPLKLDAAALNKCLQVEKLSNTVSTAVNEIASPANLPPVLVSLSETYKDYQLPNDEILPVFGNALLSSLASVLGPTFTDEVREAWGSAYTLLVNYKNKSDCKN